MNERTKRIVGRALDEALALEVVNLFGVLNRADDDDGMERFDRGLDKVTAAYEKVLDEFELNDLEGESHG